MQLVPLLELLCLQLSWIVLFSVHRGNKHAPVHYQLSNLVPSLNGVSIIYKVTFKVLSYQYEEIKLQNMVTFLDRGGIVVKRQVRQFSVISWPK